MASVTSTAPVLIQGGMGAGVSDWRLARAVSSLGQLGVVSGTGIDTILARRLQQGDPGGHMRRGLAAFPIDGVAERIVAKYEPEQSAAAGISIRNAHRYAIEKFLEAHVVEHGELPCGRHQLAASVRCRFGFRPQRFDVDLDELRSAGRGRERAE